MKNGKINKFGAKKTFPNENVYVGPFVNEMKQGFGYQKDGVTNDQYFGEFLDDEPHGKGKYIGTFSSYQGEFWNGMKHGNGTETMGNGDKYEGYWNENKKDGDFDVTSESSVVWTETYEDGKLVTRSPSWREIQQ